jgi:hypothetical protein
MSARGLLAVLSILAAPAASFATVVFQNTGTTSGWDYLSTQNKGTLSAVSSPVYKGSTAVRARQIYVAGAGERFHSELGKRNVGKRGDDRYYGWAVRVPDNWQFTSQWYILSQLGISYSGLSCGGEPLSKSYLSGTTLKLEITTGAPCSSKSSSVTVATGFTAGVWHRLVYRYRFASDSAGQLQYWVDGSKKLERLNAANITSASNPLRWSIGLYCAQWFGRALEGSQGTRDVFVDQARVASSYNEADPSQW